MFQDRYQSIYTAYSAVLPGKFVFIYYGALMAWLHFAAGGVKYGFNKGRTDYIPPFI